MVITRKIDSKNAICGLRGGGEAARLRVLMIRPICLSLMLVPQLCLGAERLPVNDKVVPTGRGDVEEIQSALVKALPQARAATVCIQIGAGSGTGVIVSKDGLVLTASHVAQGVGRTVTLIMEDGTEVKAKTLGLMADTDAAMIQIQKEGEYPFVEIERESDLRLGDWVFALGHSGGFDKERGLVVRLGRLVRIAGRTYQSDCLLIGGDSGGPLFDLNGKLVGIHSRVGNQTQVNMHVPVRVFLENWDALKQGEFLGEGPFAEQMDKGSGFLGLGSKAHEGGGIEVVQVGENTPAQRAKIEVGDVIHQINGKAVNSRDELKAMLAELRAYDELEVVLEHKGKRKTLTVTLDER